jgi:hypothetical protein
MKGGLGLNRNRWWFWSEVKLMEFSVEKVKFAKSKFVFTGKCIGT